MNSHPNSETPADISTDDAPALVPLPMEHCPKHGCTLEDVPRVQDGGIDRICPECGLDWIQQQRVTDLQEFERKRAQEQSAVRQAALEQRIGAAGIPARFRDFSFDTFPASTSDNAHALATARSYANQWPAMFEKGVSILIIGHTGTGKTGLACSIANQVLRDRAATAMFMSAYGAVRHQRDTWGRKNRTEREALDDLVNVDLLVLDEVGASVGTDVEKAMLFEVLNGRYAARRPTILLSNLPMNDFNDAGSQHPGLRTFLGDRVIERFRDDGSFVLTLTGDSLRGPPRRRPTAASEEWNPA